MRASIRQEVFGRRRDFGVVVVPNAENTGKTIAAAGSTCSTRGKRVSDM